LFVPKNHGIKGAGGAQVDLSGEQSLNQREILEVSSRPAPLANAERCAFGPYVVRERSASGLYGGGELCVRFVPRGRGRGRTDASVRPQVVKAQFQIDGERFERELPELFHRWDKASRFTRPSPPATLHAPPSSDFDIARPSLE